MTKALLFTGLAAAAFGWWGVYTTAGRQRFDEMAGILPLAALWFGGLCALIGGALLLFRRG